LPPIEGRTISNKISTFMDAIKSGEVEDTFGWILKA
jgi:hypothetical protein